MYCTLFYTFFQLIYYNVQILSHMAHILCLFDALICNSRFLCSRRLWLSRSPTTLSLQHPLRGDLRDTSVRCAVSSRGTRAQPVADTSVHCAAASSTAPLAVSSGPAEELSLLISITRSNTLIGFMFHKIFILHFFKTGLSLVDHCPDFIILYEYE